MATYYWIGGSGTWDSASAARWSTASGGVGGSTLPSSADDVIFDINSGAGSFIVTMGAANTVRNLMLTSGTLSLNGFNLNAQAFNSNNTNTRSVDFGANQIILTPASSGATVLNMATATGFTSTGTGGFASAMPTVALFFLGSTAGSITSSANLFLTGGFAQAQIATGSYFKKFESAGYGGTVTGTLTSTTTLNVATVNIQSGFNATNITFRTVADGTITTNYTIIGNVDVGGLPVSSDSYSANTIATALQGPVGTALTIPSAASGPVSAYTGNADDGFFTITPGWNIEFNGISYTTIHPASNGYITFGTGSNQWSALSAINPPHPKIMMQANDRSAQRMYYQQTGTAPNRVFWWRMEASVGTNGTVGSPTMLYEGYLYENAPGTIDIITGAMPTGGVTGVYSASALLSAAPGLGTANTGTRIEYVPATPVYSNPTTVVNDVLQVNGQVTLSSGTLRTTTYAGIISGSFAATTAAAKTLTLGTYSLFNVANWTVTNPGLFTFTWGTYSGIILYSNSGSPHTFAGGGKSYPSTRVDYLGTVTITGSNTFSWFGVTLGYSQVIKFAAGTTTTVGTAYFAENPGKVISLTTDTGAGTFTLSQASGTVSASNVYIANCNATGGATWLAPTTAGNLNGGNNTGWDFTPGASTAKPGNFLAFF